MMGQIYSHGVILPESLIKLKIADRIKISWVIMEELY